MTKKRLTLSLHLTQTKNCIKEDVIVPAGSTSWGPRTDLLLKPDVSAPGKNIKSTLNVINGNQLMVICQGLVWQLQF